METTGDARQSTARLRRLYRLKKKEHKSMVIILNIKREPFIRGNKPNGVKSTANKVQKLLFKGVSFPEISL